MKKNDSPFWALLFLLAQPAFLFSQNHWEAGLSGGYTNYFGDLVQPYFTFKEANPAGQVFIRKHFDAHHALRANFLYGKIAGDDANFDRLNSRGNSFEASMMEFSLLGELDFFGKKRYPKKGAYQKATTPYLSTGLALLLAEPDVVYGNPEDIDRELDYRGWHIAVPVIAGLKKDLNEKMALGLELGLRLTLTDNLDGVQLTGNPNLNDAYFFGGLSFGYRFVKNPDGVPVTTE